MDLLDLCKEYKLNYNSCILKIQKQYPRYVHYIIYRTKIDRVISYWLTEDMVTYLLDNKSK